MSNRFVAELRKLIREEARRVSPPVQRWRVVKLKPFTLESLSSDHRLVEGDDDLDVSRDLKKDAKVGDIAIVHLDEDDDYVVTNLLD